MKTHITNLVAVLIIMIGGVYLTVPQNAQAKSTNFISTSATCSCKNGDTLSQCSGDKCQCNTDGTCSACNKFLGLFGCKSLDKE